MTLAPLDSAPPRRRTHWPAGERPREKLLERGPAALSDAELLALLLGTGMRGASDADITSALAAVWAGRDDRYSELRAAQPAAPANGERRVEMHYIGG